MEDGIEELTVHFPPNFALPAVIEIADELMAYRQCMNLNFESVVCFHELAHKEGNEEANQHVHFGT